MNGSKYKSQNEIWKWERPDRLSLHGEENRLFVVVVGVSTGDFEPCLSTATKQYSTCRYRLRRFHAGLHAYLIFALRRADAAESLRVAMDCYPRTVFPGPHRRGSPACDEVAPDFRTEELSLRYLPGGVPAVCRATPN